MPPATQLLLNHVHDLNSGRLACELKGFLGSPPATGVTPQGLWQIDGIKKNFVTEFEAEYAKMKKPSVGEKECVLFHFAALCV